MHDLDKLAHEIHQIAVDHGWWENGVAERNEGEAIALMHSELSEALEEIRDGRPAIYYDEANPNKPEGWLVEYADCIIRILDTVTAKGYSILPAMEAKIAYNRERPYKHGGKAF